MEQAVELVRRVQGMKQWRSEWKMVSILIGHNDLCLKSCYTFLNDVIPRTRVMADNYDRSVRRVVRYLQTHLPRTLVLLLTPADVTIADDVPNPPLACHFARKLECPCLFNLDKKQSRVKLKKLWKMYRQ